MILGTHYIISFTVHDKTILDDIELLKNKLIKISNTAELNILNIFSHKFTPQGCTITIALSESHITIHTWPEHNYATIDLFTCSKAEKALKGLQQFIKETNIEFFAINKIENHSLPGLYPAIVSSPCEIKNQLTGHSQRSRENA